jgi:hypothetical protein
MKMLHFLSKAKPSFSINFHLEGNKVKKIAVSYKKIDNEVILINPPIGPSPVPKPPHDPYDIDPALKNKLFEYINQLFK